MGGPTAPKSMIGTFVQILGVDGILGLYKGVGMQPSAQLFLHKSDNHPPAICGVDTSVDLYHHEVWPLRGTEALCFTPTFPSQSHCNVICLRLRGRTRREPYRYTQHPNAKRSFSSPREAPQLQACNRWILSHPPGRRTSNSLPWLMAQLNSRCSHELKSVGFVRLGQTSSRGQVWNTRYSRDPFRIFFLR